MNNDSCLYQNNHKYVAYPVTYDFERQSIVMCEKCGWIRGLFVGSYILTVQDETPTKKEKS